MAFIVADDKVEDFLKEKADKDRVKQIYKVAERFEKHHKPKPQTNVDRIRAMSDEELAKLFGTCAGACHLCAYRNIKCVSNNYNCVDGILQWLKSEVKT